MGGPVPPARQTRVRTCFSGDLTFHTLSSVLSSVICRLSTSITFNNGVSRHWLSAATAESHAFWSRRSKVPRCRSHVTPHDAAGVPLGFSGEV